jgi:integrase/recombinase XerD
MRGKCKTYEEITSGAADCMRKKRSRTDGTIRHYNVLWRKVKRYMEFQEIRYFDSTVGKDYLLQEFGNRDYSMLSKNEKDLVRGVNVLCEFQETGSLLPVKEQTVFEGPIGQLMTKYLSYKISLRLKKHTIDEKEQHLYRFLCYLNEHDITSVNAINQLHVLYFIKGIDPRFSALPHLTMRTLRGFFSYMYAQHMIDVDLAGIIPKDNFKKQAKLPSIYSQKEIETMLASINRGNANGKRNYAIVILAARLGLRASDIANLKFENIQWEQCTIKFNQYKTGKNLELPMLPEVGNAIVDYLKYGRPKSNETSIFLLSRSPYTPIYSGSITGIVHTSLVRAGISIENRKHGAHALRHSLASILLEKGTILPIISEVLGHENTESTKYYLRIDLKSLRQCVIEVPSVSTSFYGQKGGYFYE